MRVSHWCDHDRDEQVSMNFCRQFKLSPFLEVRSKRVTVNVSSERSHSYSSKSRQSQLWALTSPMMAKPFRRHVVDRLKPPPLRAFSAQARFDHASFDDLGQPHYLRPASLATPRQVQEPYGIPNFRNRIAPNLISACSISR
jgi:hypothetical protein